MRCDRKDTRIPSIRNCSRACTHPPLRLDFLCVNPCDRVHSQLNAFEEIIIEYSLFPSSLSFSKQRSRSRLLSRKEERGTGDTFQFIEKASEEGSVKPTSWAWMIEPGVRGQWEAADRLCTVASLPTIKLRQVCGALCGLYIQRDTRH